MLVTATSVRALVSISAVEAIAKESDDWNWKPKGQAKNSATILHRNPKHSFNSSQQKGVTVTTVTYPELLKNRLKPAIRTKRRRTLSKGILLQHDDARPHMLQVQLQPHSHYSPYFTLSNYHVFDQLIKALGEK